MARLQCPQCGSRVAARAGVAPQCPECGFGAPMAAPAPGAWSSAFTVLPEPPPAPGTSGPPQRFTIHAMPPASQEPTPLQGRRRRVALGIALVVIVLGGAAFLFRNLFL